MPNQGNETLQPRQCIKETIVGKGSGREDETCSDKDGKDEDEDAAVCGEECVSKTDVGVVEEECGVACLYPWILEE